MTGPAAETNLLVQPLVRVVLMDGVTEPVSLPTLYQHLMADRVSSLPALRPHQKHALHAFLVQVGALALVTADRAEPPASASEWAELLRGLTPGHAGDEPWSLVVDDLSKPALLQPPVPQGTLDALKDVERTPDALDTLVTSKNHDLKAARITDAAPDDWLFALITLQTTEGFLGRGNYGISRMNGGFASRPAVGLAPPGGWGARVRRDIVRLLECRPAILERFQQYPERGGIGLVWLEPWDGVSQLQPRQLDPFYVEICRRIRLVGSDGHIAARRGASEAERIAFPDGYNGITGDPWTPANRSGNAEKALTIDASGFHYRRVADVIDARAFRPAPLQEPAASDGSAGLILTLAATARGQGETQGHHERSIPIPPKVVAFWGGGGADKVAELAKSRVEDAGTLRLKVLKPALLSLFQNAPDKLDYKHVASNRKAEPYLGALDREIDRTFFEDLFDELTADELDNREQLRRTWLLRLKAQCAGYPRHGRGGLTAQPRAPLPEPGGGRAAPRARVPSHFGRPLCGAVRPASGGACMNQTTVGSPRLQQAAHPGAPQAPLPGSARRDGARGSPAVAGRGNG